jgi:cobalamin biosynthesis protein CobT
MKEILARKCDAIKSLARYLGRDYEVEVIYDPFGRCMTNGKQILMPIMSDETYEEYEDFLVGITFHETGHVAHTDIKLYEETEDPIQNTFLNALDDYRVETFQKEDYKSGAYELGKLHAFAKEKNRKNMEEKPGYKEMLTTDPTAMLWAVSAAIYSKISGSSYDDFPEKIQEIVDYTDDILEEFKGQLIRDKKEGTAKAKEYALKLEKRLEEYLTRPPRQKKPKEGEGKEGEGKEGKGKEGKGKEGKGGKGQGKEGKGEKEKGKEGKGKEEESAGKEMIAGMRKCTPMDIHEGIKREIQNIVICSRKKDTLHHVPHPKALAEDIEVIPEFRVSQKVQKTYSLIKEKIQNEIDAMKSRLLALLMARKRMHFLPDADHGEIDQASIYSLRHGNKHIFERRATGKRLNTAVEILIDCSGSMSWDEKWEGAMEAGIACGETLEVLKVPFEITGYTTSYMPDDDDFSEEEYAAYNRFEPLKHFIFKGFNENYQSIKYRMMRITSNANNGDPESVWWAACRLSKRREDRKILIVMSDGRPAMSWHCDVRILERELKRVVKKIIRLGIEVYGIGIYTDTPRLFYPDYSVISKGKGDIAAAVYECLSKKLMNGGGTHEF